MMRLTDSGQRSWKLASAHLPNQKEESTLTSAQMHDTDPEIQRLSGTFDFAHNSFFAAFERRYPGTSREDYEQKIVKAVVAADFSGGQLMARLLKNPYEVVKPDEGFIYAGNAYLVQASAAMREKRLLDAAHFLMMAMFCSGILLATGSLEHAEDVVRADQRANIASLGSEGRKKLYEARISKANEIEQRLRLRHPNGWPSVRQAAIAVWAELRGMELPGAKLKEDQAVATLSAWLKGVPVNKLRKKGSSK
jgi:hypothetical protein